MLLVIDNFDSFTYNLVQYFGQLGVEQKVYRNNEVGPEIIADLKPDRVVISPGPCSPNEAGQSIPIIDATVKAGIPLFGVCLGHQCIGQYYGGKIIQATRMLHGKTSLMHHKGDGLFAGLPQPFLGTRYHSLLIERSTFPTELKITAETDAGEIMGLEHPEKPIFGVQFHPESLATESGMMILENFLRLTAKNGL